MTQPLGPAASQTGEDPGPPGPHGPPGGWREPRLEYVLLSGLAAVGAGMGSLTPAVLTLTLKADLIDPRNSTSILAVVVGVAGLSGLVSFPVLGRLSDRTTSRLGRRRPYLLLGSVLFALGGLGIVAASSVPVLVVSNILTAVGYSSTLVAVTATIADQIEPSRRGPVSALVGLSLPLGALCGLFVAQAVSPNLTLQILLPALVAVAGPALLAARISDRRLAPQDRPIFDRGQVLATFWVSPRTYPNFAWTWGSRFLIYFGVSALQAYQVFYLLDVLDFNDDTVARAVFLTTLVLTGVALVFAPVAGKISDAVGRRKPFVAASALVFAVGLVLAALAESFTAFMIATAVVGLGQGVYFAVDLALVTQVLPDQENTAKDLGIMNLASTLPFAIVPLGAPLLLALNASDAIPKNYSALFLAGAVAGILGALLILPIKRIR